MRILIECEVEKLSGPFRSAEAVGQNLADEWLSGSTTDVDGSEYEVTSARWYGPESKQVRKKRIT